MVKHKGLCYIGEVVAVYPLEGMQPLAYHKKEYWKLREKIAKPEKSELEKIDYIINKNLAVK